MSPSKQASILSTVRTFLQSKNVAVVATISSDSRPHSATINYIINDDFEFFFLTKETSEKFLHIKSNPEVSITVYDDQLLPLSAQMRGEAQVMQDEAVRIKVQKALVDSFWEKAYLPPILKMPGWGTVLIQVKIGEIKWFMIHSEKDSVDFHHFVLSNQ